MNKNGYRVIFSKTLQRWVVVSEFSQGESKATTAFKPFFTPSLSHVAIKPLVFSLYCALGFVVFSDLALANLIIQADTSAPKTQQAIILQTANGLPQVNIQTPNSKGLSHNKYAQFDVDTKGVILNNSHTYVQTQQGGWVQGNPYLARGEAKVILNEVNSSNPSQLKGYVEVAGKKADVIIANPSGIHCAGCGVINSGRTTFTTGNPHIKDGQVDSFTVEKGKVSVSGKGLDNSRVDYTEIIARETEMNAGIWSNKKLTVVTGENTIKRTATSASQNDNDHLKIIHTKPTDNVTQPTEKYAVDVSELGGMYAGKIHLIGTEQGLGVRNAGHIGASVDTLTIDSQGRIVNTGTLNAQKSVQLTSTKGIENRGKIENRRSNIHLSTQADIQQDGSMVARAGNINQQANTQISQQGETVAKGNITYLAPKVTASTSSWIVAGVDIKDSADGEVRSLETASSQGQHIVVTTSGKTTLQGKNLASGKIQVNAAEAHLDNSQTSAYSIHIEAKQGNILADNAILVAEKEIAFRTPTQLQTENSVVKAQKITTKQTALNTKKAVWEQTGTDELKLDVLDTLQNQGGTFKTQGDLRVKANGINNQQGRLIAKGKLTINAAKGKVDSTQGALVSKQDLRVMSGELVNDAGVMQSQQNIAINTPGQNLSNKQTLTEAQDKGIVALGELTLQSQALLNQNGRIIAKGNANIHAEQLKNETGEIRVGQQGKLDAVHLDNQAGTIVSVGGDLSLTTPTILNNQQGYISANNTLSLQTQGVENQQGNIISSNNLVIDSAEHLLNNLKGTLFATHQTEIHAGELNNQYGLIRADNTLVINTNRHALDNRNTQAIQQGIVGGGEVMLKNVTTLLNQQGSLYGENALDITTQVETNNQQGTIQSNGKLSLVTPKLDNRAGDIASYVGNITAQYIDNRAVSNRGSLIYGENLSLVTQQLDNQETKATGDIPTQGIQGERLAIQSASLSNQHGGCIVQIQHRLPQANKLTTNRVSYCQPMLFL
ncbi:protein PfhB1 [[Pasteurella] mairii]|uniref:Protein PfhB1 n=1 Tax=[Pasteurella] mairii TaxID=757 RepID=A0A379B807_9PAST|nr:protein PfhB1 [[Pasteurella] mairii]SUB34666.1 protein PfhB1 [[Pasteurella] mairii]